jgi:hypothetical protein
MAFLDFRLLAGPAAIIDGTIAKNYRHGSLLESLLAARVSRVCRVDRGGQTMAAFTSEFSNHQSYQ